MKYLASKQKIMTSFLAKEKWLKAEYYCWTEITSYIFIVCCYPLFKFLPKKQGYTTGPK